MALVLHVFCIEPVSDTYTFQPDDREFKGNHPNEDVNVYQILLKTTNVNLMVTLEESQQITKVMRFIEDMALYFCSTVVVDIQSGRKWCTDQLILQSTEPQSQYDLIDMFFPKCQFWIL